MLEGFQRLVMAFQGKVTLPIVLMSPVLFFFTVYSCLDPTFLDSDKQVVVLLWVLVVLSIATFLLMKKDGEAPPVLMFTLGSAQLVGVVAACLSMMAVVEEDSATPRRRLSDVFNATPFMIKHPTRQEHQIQPNSFVHVKLH